MKSTASDRPTFRVVVVVVTYNRLEKLRATAMRLLAMPFYRVVVVDNGSTDGTAAWLKACASTERRLVHLRLEKNAGGAGGFHRGVEYVHERLRYDYLLLQDDDAWPAEDALSRLDACGRADAIAAAVYLPDGRISPMNVPGFHPFAGIRQTFETILKGAAGFHLRRSDFAARQCRRIGFSSFVGLYISRKTVDEIGYPDPEWFIYGDDIDYTLRIYEKGLNFQFSPQVVHYHDCKTFLNEAKVYYPAWKLYYHLRNLVILYGKIAGNWILWPVLMLKLPKIWLWQYRYPRKERACFRKAFRQALHDGLKGDRGRPFSEVISLCKNRGGPDAD